MFQSSTRQTDFATLLGQVELQGLPQVSILYEADRLCNSWGLRGPTPPALSFNPLRGRQTLQPPRAAWGHRGCRAFQSSTRQTDFATKVARAWRAASVLFQSSTRQTDFATRRRARPPGPHQRVSILYEADRLCNRLDGTAHLASGMVFQSSTRQTDFATDEERPAASRAVPVSILYEADRLCNCPCQEAAPDRGS